MNRNYQSNVLDIRRPPLIIHVVQVTVGVVMLLMALVAIPTLYSDTTDVTDDISKFADYYNELVDDDRWDVFGDKALQAAQLAQAASIGMFAVFFVPGIFAVASRSVRSIMGGFNNIMLPSRPARIPADFEDTNAVINALERHTIERAYPENPPLFIRTLFGANSRFISPVHRLVVVSNARSLSGRTFWAIVAVVLLVAAYLAMPAIASEDTLLEAGETTLNRFDRIILTWLEDEDFQQKTLLPFALYFGLQFVLGAVQYLSIMSLVPRRQPNTSSREGSEHYRGFGHPNTIFYRLPDLAGPLQWGHFPNRADQNWAEGRSPTVSDTGTFNGYIFVEQQPQPMRVNGGIGALLLLIAGAGLMLVAVYLMLFELLPSAVPSFANRGNVPYTERIPYMFGPAYVAMMGYVAWRFYANGVRFTKQAVYLYTNSWFRSEAILIRCVGNHSRADVRVGKSVADSIESSSVVVRSDFTARFFAGTLISEARDLESRRKLLAIEISPANDAWIDFFRKEIVKLREEGVRPVGVDIGSPEVSDIIRANVHVSGARSGVEAQAQLLAGQEAQQYSPSAQLQQGGVPAPQIAPPAPGQYVSSSTPAPAAPIPVPTDSKPPEPKTAEDIEAVIDQLDQQLAAGAISEATYVRLVDRWQKKLAAIQGETPESKPADFSEQDTMIGYSPGDDDSPQE